MSLIGRISAFGARFAGTLAPSQPLAAGAELLTRNRRHFTRVPSLRLAAVD